MADGGEAPKVADAKVAEETKRETATANKDDDNSHRKPSVAPIKYSSQPEDVDLRPPSPKASPPTEMLQSNNQQSSPSETTASSSMQG